MEEGVELVEFALGDGVEFVVVADSALGGEAEPGVGGRHGAVDGVAEDVFGVRSSRLRWS